MDPQTNQKSPVSRILAPTDFSDCAAGGLDYAVTLAKSFNAALILIHVVEANPYTIAQGLNLINYKERLLSDLSKRLLKEKIAAEAHLVHGIPFREIVHLAEREKADLIVIGTHGRTGFDHLITGSVAEKVLRLAPCPVITLCSRYNAPGKMSRNPKKRAAMGDPREKGQAG